MALICINVDLTKSLYCLVFSCLLNACRFQLSPMHVHSYYYTHHSVVQVKGNNDDIWWTDWDEKSWYELDLSCFCKYDEFIVPDSAYYEVNIFAMTVRDYSCLCHAWLAMSYNSLLACQHAIRMIMMWYDGMVSNFEWIEWLDLAHVHACSWNKST